MFPLHISAKEGNAAMTELLLKYVLFAFRTFLKLTSRRHAAKVGCMDADGSTPLHYAAKGGHKEALLVLLNNDAQVSATKSHH